MGLFSRLTRKSAEQTERRADALDNSIPGKKNYWHSISSPAVTDGLAASYACKLAIAESVSMLPAVLMSEEEGGKKVISKEDRLYDLLKYAPNDLMSSIDFFESQTNCRLDDGNSYARIGRSKTDEVTSLLPLPPDRMTVKILDDNRLGYIYRDGRSERMYSSKEIFHVRYNTKDGIMGRSPAAECENVFRMASNIQSHGVKVYERGAFLGGFIVVPPTYAFENDEKRKEFMDSFKQYLGSDNYNKFALLEDGMEYKQFTQNNKDNQYIEASQFCVTNVARIYRVPPVMIGVTESGMSYASIEQLGIMWVTYTIQPHVARYEAAIKHQLIGYKDPRFVKFNIKSLLRGDLKAQTEALVMQVQHGLKTVNEARQLNDDNKSDDPIADKILISHNLLQGINGNEASSQNNQ